MVAFVLGFVFVAMILLPAIATVPAIVTFIHSARSGDRNYNY